MEASFHIQTSVITNARQNGVQKFPFFAQLAILFISLRNELLPGLETDFYN
jgi:hypothetical protein